MRRRCWHALGLLALSAACAGAPGTREGQLALELAACALPADAGPNVYDPVTVADTDPDSVWIDLNIPAFRLRVMEGERLAREFAVSVGMRRYPTPTGSFSITTILWNPAWEPPESDWAAKEKPRAPGPSNPMGKVKLGFSPLYFLHGTPDSGSVGHARSHGCVRMSNGSATQLALLLQQYYAAVDSASINEALTTRRTRTVKLIQPVTLRIRYDILEVTDTAMIVYPDVYYRDSNTMQRVIDALVAAGVPEIDTAKVRTFVSGPRPAHAPLHNSFWR